MKTFWQNIKSRLTRKSSLRKAGLLPMAAASRGVPRRALAVTAAAAFASVGLGAPATALSIPQNVLFHISTNIKNFKVKGDGSDETANIQAAINAASSNGTYCVFFPSGTYGISSPLTCPLNVSLLGVYSSQDLDPNFAPISSILALTGFPASTAMISFATGWGGRFEHLTIDGGNIASGGVSQLGSRGCICHDIMIKRIANHSSSDNCWYIGADVPNSRAAAQCLYSRIEISNYSIAAGTNSIIFDGGGSQATGVTEVTFVSCNIGTGAGGCALNITNNCDHNWFYGCNFDSNSNSVPTITLNNTTTNNFVVGNYFTACTVFNNGSGPSVSVQYTNGIHNEFTDCYLYSLAGTYDTTVFIGTGGRIKMKGGSLNDFWIGALPVIVISSLASGVAWTNNKPYAVQINIIGGTVSAVNFYRLTNTFGLGQNANMFILQPGDQFSVSYTSPPTFEAIPQAA